MIRNFKAENNEKTKKRLSDRQCNNCNESANKLINFFTALVGVIFFSKVYTLIEMKRKD